MERCLATSDFTGMHVAITPKRRLGLMCASTVVAQRQQPDLLAVCGTLSINLEQQVLSFLSLSCRVRIAARSQYAKQSDYDGTYNAHQGRDPDIL